MYKVKITSETFVIHEQIENNRVSIVEETQKARINIENRYSIEDKTKEEKIRILMLKGEKGDSGGFDGDYNALSNKPQINTVTLQGNKTAKQLHLQEEIDRITNSDIEEMLNSFVE